MKIQLYLIAILFTFLTNTLYSQNSSSIALNEYFRAKENFEAGIFSSALNELKKAEQAGGKTNEYIESLKALCYYELKDIEKSEQALKKFYNYSCSNEELKKQMSELAQKIQKYHQTQKVKELTNEKTLLEAENKVMTSSFFLVQSEIELQNAIVQEAIVYKSELEEQVNILSKLEEGRVYVFKPKNRISAHNNEQSYFVFYEDKYIIFTIPSFQVLRELNKKTVSFGNYEAQRYSDYVTNLKVKTNSGKKEYSFHKVPHYSNVFIGGGGDELLWSGQQYTTFKQTLYYYDYQGYLGVDIDMYTDFKSGYYNPYIEVGHISKTIDYRIVIDTAISKQLVKLNVINRKASSEKLRVSLKSTSNRKMIYPEKHITYTMMDQNLEGTYSGDNKNFRSGFLYFVPQTYTSHYGFIEYSGSFYSDNLLNDLFLTDNRVIIDKNSFNSVYETFKQTFGSGVMKHFTDSNYTIPYDLMIELGKAYSANLKTLKEAFGE